MSDSSNSDEGKEITVQMKLINDLTQGIMSKKKGNQKNSKVKSQKIDYLSIIKSKIGMEVKNKMTKKQSVLLIEKYAYKFIKRKRA